MPIDRRFVGKEYPAIVYEMGREKIREYARAVGDLNPLYLDEQAGRASPHGDMVAPPTMASQYALMTVEQLFQDDELALDVEMVVHSEQDYRFFRPVRPGDRLQVKGRIKDLADKRGLQFVVFETEVTNQRGEKVTEATATLLVRPRREVRQ
jgi:acyl dehydratase